MEYLLELAASPTAWVALATLVVMEIVLGIDNLIFISILTNKLPEEQRELLFLVAIEGMSYQEAAATLEIPIGTVMSRLAATRPIADATNRRRALPARPCRSAAISTEVRPD